MSSTTATAATASSGADLDTETTGSGSNAPRVRLQTTIGDLVFEIYETDAPITAGNFLTYVDDGLLTGATFYRTVTLDNQGPREVPIEVIQGGLGVVRTLPPIPHETTEQTGILHLDGTISMARAEVGTATSEFFVCIGDQPALDFGGERNPDGQGFAAFGRLVEGDDVAFQIQQQPANGQSLEPPIAITSVTRE
ncbi:MAG: peptidylprolyl isomerase [Deltaproteobacteria bacterium]|nr:peptidylprolyl isomerase [Deltaproteobacteria bacterium]